MRLILKKIVKYHPQQKQQNQTQVQPLIFTQNFKWPEIDPLRQTNPIIEL